MKKKKIIAYFLAAAISMAAPFGLSVFAVSNEILNPAVNEADNLNEIDSPNEINPNEDDNPNEIDSPNEINPNEDDNPNENENPEQSSSSTEALESTTESAPPESTTAGETEPEETTTEFLFTFPSETTTEPEVQIITTPDPPVETTTKPAPIAVETEAPTTTTTTSAAPESVAEEETEPEEITAASNNGQGVTTMGSETALIAPVEGDEPGIPDVAEGDPGGDFITTIILIALGFVGFILVLTMPAIIKKIKRKIVYKY